MWKYVFIACEQFEFNLLRNEEAKSNSQNLPKKKIKINSFTHKKQVAVSIFSIQCEEGYNISIISKFQSNSFNSFHVKT